MNRRRWREETFLFEVWILFGLDSENIISTVLVGSVDLLVRILRQNIHRWI